MPIANAFDNDAVLAYEANGGTLPLDHGFRIRSP
jgi:DMSO/TMAO reductase YedYZ molybdopterin-dependent catalytic subunit